MKEHHILGVSLAIIENGEIRQAKGYGFTDQTRRTPVTTARCFRQALSANRWRPLVEDARLSLDDDVRVVAFISLLLAVSGFWFAFGSVFSFLLGLLFVYVRWLRGQRNV
jgi:hypothetical protein